MGTSETLRRKYTGCMLGAAIGDALGKQNEGLSREDILSKGYITDYGKAHRGCPGEKLRPGQYTDDTEQMLVLSRSLIECRGFDISDFAVRIARWGHHALNDPARKSLIGPSSAQAIARLNKGADWEVSGSSIPSCGSAMRAAPIGLFYSNMDDIEFNAAMSSLPTHNSKEAIAGAVAVAVAVRCALDGMDSIDIIKETCIRASKYDTDLAKRIEVSFLKRNTEPDRAFAQLGTSYLVYETVPSAFYCFTRHPEDSRKAILEAVNAGGDTDSIACITGAMCGAMNGEASLLETWKRGLENRDLIEYLADMLFEN